MSAVRHFRLIGQVLSCAVDFLGEAQRSVLVAREIKKTKAGGTGDSQGIRAERGRGRMNIARCCHLVVHMDICRDQEKRSIWVWPGRGLLAMAALRSLVSSGPSHTGIGVENLEPLCHLCICPAPSSALHSAHIPPKEARWGALMSSSNIQRTTLNKNS